MCDDDIHQDVVNVDEPKVSRRTFGLMSMAMAGVGAGASAEAAAGVVEKDVQVKTPDGEADAVLFHPQGQGPWPAVLVWPDIMGLRPIYREMGRRLSAQGYVVLIPNPFYRSAKAPVVSGTVNFSDPDTRAKLMGMRQAMSDAGVDSDAQAHVGFLDAQPQTDKARKVGVQGYCMGGALSFRTAAAAPDRIAAVASFHGGNGLMTDQPNSPHLLVSKTHATYLVCQARNDDAQKPEMKDQLRAYFAQVGVPATVELYNADHGWCVPTAGVYDEGEAERAWSELSKLYKAKLG